MSHQDNSPERWAEVWWQLWETATPTEKTDLESRKQRWLSKSGTAEGRASQESILRDMEPPAIVPVQPLTKETALQFLDDSLAAYFRILDFAQPDVDVSFWWGSVTQWWDRVAAPTIGAPGEFIAIPGIPFPVFIPPPERLTYKDGLAELAKIDRMSTELNVTLFLAEAAFDAAHYLMTDVPIDVTEAEFFRTKAWPTAIGALIEYFSVLTNRNGDSTTTMSDWLESHGEDGLAALGSVFNRHYGSLGDLHGSQILSKFKSADPAEIRAWVGAEFIEARNLASVDPEETDDPTLMRLPPTKEEVFASPVHIGPAGLVRRMLESKDPRIGKRQGADYDLLIESLASGAMTQAEARSFGPTWAAVESFRSTGLVTSGGSLEQQFRLAVSELTPVLSARGRELLLANPGAFLDLWRQAQADATVGLDDPVEQFIAQSTVQDWFVDNLDLYQGFLDTQLQEASAAEIAAEATVNPLASRLMSLGIERSAAEVWANGMQRQPGETFSSYLGRLDVVVEQVTEAARVFDPEFAAGDVLEQNIDLLDPVFQTLRDLQGIPELAPIITDIFIARNMKRVREGLVQLAALGVTDEGITNLFFETAGIPEEFLTGLRDRATFLARELPATEQAQIAFQLTSQARARFLEFQQFTVAQEQFGALQPIQIDPQLLRQRTEQEFGRVAAAEGLQELEEAQEVGPEFARSLRVRAAETAQEQLRREAEAVRAPGLQQQFFESTLPAPEPQRQRRVFGRPFRR